MANDPGKRCRRCGEQKPITEFYRDATKASGRRPTCRACMGYGHPRRWTRGANPYGERNSVASRSLTKAAQERAELNRRVFMEEFTARESWANRGCVA